MSVSRKEFLTRGLAAFSREVVNSVRGELEHEGNGGGAESCGPLLVDNRHCLAQRGGCFACLDQCPQEAITISLGVGIEIDLSRCDGCGLCIDRCPVTPRVISLKQL
mgnify:CR=1 FL=1